MTQPAADTWLRELAPAIAARLPAILDEVRELLADRHPDYAAFLAEQIDEVAAAAESFVGRLIGSDPGSGVEQALFEEIGRLHHGQGRDVISLLAAYRTGATVAWRHVSEAALALDAPVDAVAGLAGVVFAAVDQLSSASLHGYLSEQTDAAHARDHLRTELAEMLLSDRSDSAAVRAAAARADWSPPQQAAVVLVDPDSEVARVLLARLDGTCLHLRRPDARIAIVPDASGPGRRDRLAGALRGAGAVVGSTVPLDRLPASLPLVELAARLHKTDLLNDDPLFVDEHLDAIIVHGNESLLAALRRKHLAPLDGLPHRARERLEATLTSWLLNMGDRRAIAGELQIHPQTVRYRLGQLRELFGPALEDPSARATLLLALGWGSAAPESEQLCPQPPAGRHPGRHA
ncbi:MAG: PucR family transcriptional regulator [Pseudonocardia sp.]